MAVTYINLAENDPPVHNLLLIADDCEKLISSLSSPEEWMSGNIHHSVTFIFYIDFHSYIRLLFVLL